MTYLVFIVVWSVPIIAIQWTFGWRTLWLEWRPLVATIVMATVYLGCTDIVAVNDGIWMLNPAKTLGLSAGGFVFEDWLFLFATNAMIAQTVVLALDPDIRDRVRRWLHRR